MAGLGAIVRRGCAGAIGCGSGAGAGFRFAGAGGGTPIVGGGAVVGACKGEAGGDGECSRLWVPSADDDGGVEPSDDMWRR